MRHQDLIAPSTNIIALVADNLRLRGWDTSDWFPVHGIAKNYSC